HLSGCPVPFELRLSGRSLPRDTPELAPASVIFALSPDPGPAAFSTTELQVRICEGFTEAFWQTYRSLLQKRAAETLTPEEQQQLIALSDEIEERDGQRLVYLAELARRRSVPVRTLMQQLGLRPATVA
ncbi:hypothetical protein, partial [Armatimonas sp.]|uniref:hypothetical protein n=1 Tax=Armatimonas sp. TaxID=1872638 RepID=UPI003751227E